MDKSIELYQAIITELKNKAELQAITENKVYAHIPQNTEFPYIRVSLSSQARANNTELDQEYIIRVQAFSKAKSPYQALTLRSEIFNTLNRATLSLNIPNETYYLQATGLQECFLEDGQEIWQAILEFKAFVN